MVKSFGIALFLVVLGFAVLAMLFLEHEKLMLETELAMHAFTNSGVLSAAAFYLTLFMAVLLLRYAVLVVCSFLEHLRNPPRRQAGAERSDDMLPMVSVVVPAYNEGLLIERSLHALLELDYPDYEVLVIDDGSTDDTYERAQRIAQSSTRVPVRVIAKPNGGKADALNTGLLHARGEFIFNMDADTRLSSNSLRACIPHFDDPKVGAVAGNVKVLNRENALTRLQALEYVEGLALVRKAQSFFHAVSIVPGPAGLFRRAALVQVRGYDSDTFAEDCDTTMKLLLTGWQISYEPSAIAQVETPSRPLDLVKQRYRWTRGILQAARKYRSSLVQPRAGLNFFMVWYTVFETLLWPVSNVAANLFFLYVGIQHGLAVYLLYWWLQLTLLDIVAATYCVVVEDEDVSLLMYTPLFRICYLLAMDVAKVLAAVDEARGIGMTWGKLEREGKL